MYMIIEIQKQADGSGAFPPVVQRADWNEALSAYHSICASAAISSVPKHIVLLLNDDGEIMNREICRHTISE